MEPYQVLLNQIAELSWKLAIQTATVQAQAAKLKQFEASAQEAKIAEKPVEKA